jgi:hypothetical protein
MAVGVGGYKKMEYAHQNGYSIFSNGQIAPKLQRKIYAMQHALQLN